MQLSSLQRKATQLFTENASAILTSVGVAGTISTAVLAGRASFKAALVLRQEYDDAEAYPDLPVEWSMKQKIQTVGPLFIPPIGVGILTITSIVYANKINAQRAAALAAAYTVVEGNFGEYKAKVQETLGVQKADKLDVAMAQDQVDRTAGSKLVVISGDEVLCFDQPTGRFFKSNADKILRAVNATNEEILRHHYASASYFYEELEMPPTVWSDDLGWSEVMEVKFSHGKTDDNRPYLAIDFATLPKVDYVPNSY